MTSRQRIAPLAVIFFGVLLCGCSGLERNNTERSISPKTYIHFLYIVYIESYNNATPTNIGRIEAMQDIVFEIQAEMIKEKYIPGDEGSVRSERDYYLRVSQNWDTYRRVEYLRDAIRGIAIDAGVSFPPLGAHDPTQYKTGID